MMNKYGNGGLGCVPKKRRREHHHFLCSKIGFAYVTRLKLKVRSFLGCVGYESVVNVTFPRDMIAEFRRRKVQ